MRNCSVSLRVNQADKNTGSNFIDPGHGKGIKRSRKVVCRDEKIYLRNRNNAKDKSSEE